MKTINVIRYRLPSTPWESLLTALSRSGFRVNEIEPHSKELETLSTRPGDALLLDGMLPRLSRYIEQTCVRCPEMSIMVATEVDSFSIKYEVLLMSGVIYLSGPLDSAALLESIRNVVFGAGSVPPDLMALSIKNTPHYPARAAV